MVVLNAERRFERVKFQFLATFCGKLENLYYMVRYNHSYFIWNINEYSQHNHNVSWMCTGMVVTVPAATAIGQLAAKDRPNFISRSIVGGSSDLYRRCYWELRIRAFSQPFWQQAEYIVASFPSDCEFLC